MIFVTVEIVLYDVVCFFNTVASEEPSGNRSFRINMSAQDKTRNKTMIKIKMKF